MSPNDIDPDLNLQNFNDHGIFTIEEINELCAIVKPQYSSLHINTRSLNQHHEELCNLLNSIPANFDFVGCSETWLTEVSHFDRYRILGYTVVNDIRTFSTGGGVALYVKADNVYRQRGDLKVDAIENVWIETNDLIIGLIYKPPSFSNSEFLDKLEDTLHNIYLSKEKCIIMGDVNINTLSKSKTTKDYLNLIRSEGFNPLIHEATRITETTQSCIDHIHSNFSSSCTSGSIAVEIADHLPVFTIIYKPDLSPFPDNIEIRNSRK